MQLYNSFLEKVKSIKKNNFKHEIINEIFKRKYEKAS